MTSSDNRNYDEQSIYVQFMNYHRAHRGHRG